MTLRVFITGVSSGLGRALARHYATRGATLGVVARRAAELQTFAAEVTTRCAAYAVDVRDAEALAQAAAQFVAEHGCPHIVIANAGVSAGTAARCAQDLPVTREIIEINVLGLAHTFQPFIPAMQAAGTGQLVGVASVAGYRGLPGAGAYCASKAAAIAYLESMRLELRESGISVTTLCPGYIATPMTADNPYPMPFLLSAERAAQKMARAIERRRAYAVIPWQMALVARLLGILPVAVYDRLFARAPRKPRRSAR
jgi:short-subunit dehydrogenase